MKTFILCLTALVSFGINAQDYTPLLADVNEWQFTTCYLGDCSKDMYFTDGDTLVNGMSYKILDGYHYISRTFLLREDIEEQQVFLYTIVNGVTRENLLYDFSMNIGDEIDIKNPFTPFPVSGGMYTLIDIESLPLVDGNSYKHYYLSPSPGNTISTWDAVWVEGVGSLSILSAPGGEPDFDEVGALSCSFRNGDSFYSNLERVASCDAILAIKDNASTPQNIVTVDETSLTVHAAQQITAVSLYSINGKIIESKTNQAGKNNIVFSKTSLRNGIYILKFSNNTGGITSQQVLIR